MNGTSKIAAFLKENGVDIQYATTDYYRYYDGFHAHRSYPVDVYRISNGMYILAKQQGKPRYYLCEKPDMRSCKIIDFSQKHFIKRLQESDIFQK
nr:hypothetical protein [uncultured Butyrivibrio sp.]